MVLFIFVIQKVVEDVTMSALTIVEKGPFFLFGSLTHKSSRFFVEIIDGQYGVLMITQNRI
jgi:hypothetical protein